MNYGNWVSKKIIYSCIILGIVLLASTILFWPLAILSIACFGIAAYFTYARYLFSPNGRNVQNQIWDLMVSGLDWDGEGKVLDIGCGNGALTVKLARRFPAAQVTGIDFWGERWDYSRSRCEANANAEGVGNRVVFQKASASRLPFEDGYFDAAVSNLCFHEVADTRDKREVVREALRVVKKGGVFVFQDLFLLKQTYGDIDEFVRNIKSWGITRVELMETRSASFIPTALKLPFMVGRISIIKGEK